MSNTRERFYRRAATLAGLKTPKFGEDYDKHDFPHFHVFVTTQRARPHATKKTVLANANVIARFGAERVVKLTMFELMIAGFDVSPPSK